MIPEKRIRTLADIPAFQRSPAYRRLWARVNTMAQQVEGITTPQTFDPGFGAAAEHICATLGRLSALVDEVPPVAGHNRFGNPSYRVWRERVPQRIEDDEERAYYLQNAFGSLQRIDFGTGHELNFVAYFDSHVRAAPASGAATLYVFSTYFKLCKKLITAYNLEPAGSHGVWGLDDHFHIPYILGAAQLVSYDARPGPRPSDVCDAGKAAELADRYLYFEAIAFVYAMKKGRFSEHSPVLYDVSGIKTWAKIRQGMLKMYKGEVLDKFPVVQHFYFGPLFPFEDSP